MSHRIYVQSEFFDDIKLIEADEEATLEDLKKLCLLLIPIEQRELKVYLFAEDDDLLYEDRHKVKLLKKPHGIHINLHRCKNVAVNVSYCGETATKNFRPATTIGHIKKWAGKKLGMQPGDIAEHVLQLKNLSQPDTDVHIGALAKCSDCEVDFDLVPAHRING